MTSTTPRDRQTADGHNRKRTWTTVWPVVCMAAWWLFGSCGIREGCSGCNRSGSVRLEEGESQVTPYGFTFKLEQTGHKHGKGIHAGIYELTIWHGKRKKSFEYTHTTKDPYWFMEVLAFGHVFTAIPEAAVGDPKGPVSTTLHKFDKRRYRVFLKPSKKEPLSEDALQERGVDIARNAARKRGCTAPGYSSEQVDGGGVLVRFRVNNTERCEVLVGVYSETVFFKSLARP